MTQRREDPASVVADFAPTAQCLLGDGRIRYANEALGELLGVDALEGRPLDDVVDGGERVLAALAESIEEGAALDREEPDGAEANEAKTNGAGPDGDCTVRFQVEIDARRSRTVESRWRVAGPGAAPGDRSKTFVGTFEDVTDRVELERETVPQTRQSAESLARV